MKVYSVQLIEEPCDFCVEDLSYKIRLQSNKCDLDFNLCYGCINRIHTDAKNVLIDIFNQKILEKESIK